MSDPTTPTARDLRALPDPADPRATAEAILFEVRRVIVGQDAMLERILVGLLSGGHLLLEGVPGLAKTLTIKTLADVLGGILQAHPVHAGPHAVRPRRDAHLPPGRRRVRDELGPVFANFLLADEINRAPAKVQSALLEVMQEHQVTIGHDTYKVPTPFLVLATENPIEAEGTYPLPEAQVDRFMLKILLGYPNPAEEAQIVARSLAPRPPPREILDADGPGRASSAASTTSTSTRGSSATRSASSRRPASSPTGARPELEAYVSLRRQPARLDQPRSTAPAPWPSSAAAATSSRPTSPSSRPDVLRHRLV